MAKQITEFIVVNITGHATVGGLFYYSFTQQIPDPLNSNGNYWKNAPSPIVGNGTTARPILTEAQNRLAGNGIVLAYFKGYLGGQIVYEFVWNATPGITVSGDVNGTPTTETGVTTLQFASVSGAQITVSSPSAGVGKVLIDTGLILEDGQVSGTPAHTFTGINTLQLLYSTATNPGSGTVVFTPQDAGVQTFTVTTSSSSAVVTVTGGGTVGSFPLVPGVQVDIIGGNSRTIVSFNFGAGTVTLDSTAGFTGSTTMKARWPGIVNATTQTFGGDKTIDGVATITGDLNVGTTAVSGANINVMGNVNFSSPTTGPGLIAGDLDGVTPTPLFSPVRGLVTPGGEVVVSDNSLQFGSNLSAGAQAGTPDGTGYGVMLGGGPSSGSQGQRIAYGIWPASGGGLLGWGVYTTLIDGSTVSGGIITSGPTVSGFTGTIGHA